MILPILAELFYSRKGYAEIEIVKEFKDHVIIKIIEVV
jgi:hypothetical protein